MSTRALNWAFDSVIKPSSVKFVLVALADYANEDGEVYPSIETLCRKTCMDRKTVIANMQILVDMGVIADTLKRKGRTKQVKVYALCGLPGESIHYVYRLDDPATGEFYIGTHETKSGNPDTDGYMGSGCWPRQCRDRGIYLVKTVLAKFASLLEANLLETQLIATHIRDSLCMNERTNPVNGKQCHKRHSSERVPFFRGKSPKNGTQNR